MPNWTGRSGDGSERRYTDEERERNRANADAYGPVLRRYRVAEWLKGAPDAHPSLEDLRAEGYDVVSTADLAGAITAELDYDAFRFQDDDELAARLLAYVRGKGYIVVPVGLDRLPAPEPQP